MHVFHVYKKHARIPKPQYTTELRKKFKIWDKTIVSQNGFIEDGCLILPENRQDNINVKRTGGLIIQDIVGFSGTIAELNVKRKSKDRNTPKGIHENQSKQNPEILCFNNETRVWSFELFSIERNGSGDFELYLRYGLNQFSIGEPKRDDHKLYNLEKGKPIEITINGKSDSTLTSGAERIYIEYDFIIEYMGEVNKVNFVALSNVGTERTIPTLIDKKIDLRKILY